MHDGIDRTLPDVVPRETEVPNARLVYRQRIKQHNCTGISKIGMVQREIVDAGKQIRLCKLGNLQKHQKTVIAGRNRHEGNENEERG